jgi:hypothetical protein
MVNGSFLLPPKWEKVAGQTWSMRPYCRLKNLRPLNQQADIIKIFELARLSL